mmetsp:Transcript_27143/g.76358  ORF Transcript_27143/g.76358 Transcript_27143/m.76358 type:complete len:406 (-) Transcript_27143:73-1290(-)
MWWSEKVSLHSSNKQTRQTMALLSRMNSTSMMMMNVQHHHHIRRRLGQTLSRRGLVGHSFRQGGGPMSMICNTVKTNNQHQRLYYHNTVRTTSQERTTEMSDDPNIRSIQHFVKNGNIQSYCEPGFNHLLQLSFHTMDWDQLQWDPSTSTLIYNYTFDSNTKLKPSTGVFTALMDELSTNACFVYQQPSPPGWSIHIHTKLLSDGHDFIVNYYSKKKETIEIHNTVTKYTSKITFLDTKFIFQNRVLATSTQIKYMPYSSSKLDLMNYVYNSKWCFQLYAWYYQLNTIQPQKYKQGEIEFLDEPNKTKFLITKQYTNMLGTLHGACYAMIMELSLLHNKVSSAKYIVKSQQIDYLSSGKIGQIVDIVIHELDRELHLYQVQLFVENKKKPILIANGILELSTTKE